MQITVGGVVSGGTEGADLHLRKSYKDMEANIDLTVGSYSTTTFLGFTPEQEAAFIAGIKVTGLGGEQDLFWQKVMTQLQAADEGSTVTIDAGSRTTMPAKVVEIVQERNLTLVIQWNGGEDITIDASFNAEPVYGVYKLFNL